MFNVTRDTKDIYIGSSFSNSNNKQNFQHKKPAKQPNLLEDDVPKPIRMVTKDISLKVQRRRQELKLTQKELALKINKNVNVIQEIENGTAKYDRSVLNKLERVLNIKL